MKTGKTIAAEREKPAALDDSARMQERKRQRRRKGIRVALVLVFVGLMGWLMVSGVLGLIDVLTDGQGTAGAAVDTEYALKAEVIDESGAGVSRSVKNFVMEIEQDLAEYGLELGRVVLPEGKMRQLNLYLAGKSGYIKARTDRPAGVQAEDIDRMLKYMGDREYEYIDVRTERKAYWK